MIAIMVIVKQSTLKLIGNVNTDGLIPGKIFGKLVQSVPKLKKIPILRKVQSDKTRTPYARIPCG
jgi:hypothetical protein